MGLRLPFAAFFLAVAALRVASVGAAQVALVKDSPFLPPGSAAGGSGPEGGPSYELAGGSVTSQGSEVCIYDVKGKRSHWIGVGGEDGAVQVVSYDPAGDCAVVRINGVQQTLELRKEAGPVNLGSAAPFVAAGAYAPSSLPAGLTVEEARKRREARMLVTDLMDIGMRQRRAHEEAMRQAAQAGH
jgi:hypothetical protein